MSLEDSIQHIAHISWLYPDGIHDRYQLRELEPGRRDYDAPCPCRCGQDPAVSP